MSFSTWFSMHLFHFLFRLTWYWIRCNLWVWSDDIEKQRWATYAKCLLIFRKLGLSFPSLKNRSCKSDHNFSIHLFVRAGEILKVILFWALNRQKVGKAFQQHRWHYFPWRGSRGTKQDGHRGIRNFPNICFISFETLWKIWHHCWCLQLWTYLSMMLFHMMVIRRTAWNTLYPG